MRRYRTLKSRVFGTEPIPTGRLQEECDGYPEGERVRLAYRAAGSGTFDGVKLAMWSSREELAKVVREEESAGMATWRRWRPCVRLSELEGLGYGHPGSRHNR